MTEITEQTFIKLTIRNFYGLVCGIAVGLLTAFVFYLSIMSSLDSRFDLADKKQDAIIKKIDSTALMQRLTDMEQNNDIQDNKEAIKRLATIR